MEIANEPIFQWLSQYAYQPEMVYGMIIGLMIASSFGMPLPEEIPLLSGAILAFMATHPAQFPPPTPDARGVDPITLSIVCFFAVFLSDLVIFGLGRFFGGALSRSKRFSKVLTPKILERVESWTKKYGIGAVAVFRFTPGLRFPGHMACGMLGFPFSKFCLIDGTAALLSVPTQILLIAYYGETILGQLQRFKIALAVVIGVLLVLYFVNRLRTRRMQKAEQ